MKRPTMVLLAGMMVAAGLPAYAGEPKPLGPKDKDLCLLYLEGCPRKQDSLQEKIRKLEQEIAKGSEAYTEKELQILRKKLIDANETDYILNFSPSQSN